MPRPAILQTRVDSATAAQVRVHADRAHTSTSEWIATVLRREIARAGAADALALRAYELQLTAGYMLRSLMIDTLGPEAAEAAIDEAASTAAEEAAADLRHATDLP